MQLIVVMQNCSELETMVKSNSCIENVVYKWEKILDTYETLDAYSYAKLSVDTENKECIKTINKVSQLRLSINKSEVLF